MRLFVAIELDPRLAEAAGRLVDALRQRAARLAPKARITWVAAERMHLTVAFIGESDEERTQRIRGALEPHVDLAPFDLTVAGLGAFPRAGQPRVLWAGLTDGRDALLRVGRIMTDRLVLAEAAPAPRAYNPHLTLARVRESSGLRASALFEGLGKAPIGTTTVGAITLFESRLSSKGPTYVPLQRIPLRRA